MKRFTLRFDWSFKIFASLCYSQVKEQLPENLIYSQRNPPGFVCNGQLFTFVHNRSVIADEDVVEYESLFN